MSKDKKNKGITLIALIVSIIVILILASVSIAVLSNSGIIKKSKFAGENYQNKINEEEKAMQNYASTMNEYIIADNERDTITISKEEYEKLKNTNNYSTEELKIGNWINGKPIYRCVININYTNPPQQKWYELSDVKNLNIDKLIKYNISSTEEDGGTIGTVVKDAGVLKVLNDKILYFSLVNWETIDTIIIEYTKTTDIATK